MVYRSDSPRYQHAWDWDLIIYADGSVRVLCLTEGCLYESEGGHFGSACECSSRPRMSSPVVDEYQRPLRETPYDGTVTGEARHLLDAGNGAEIDVLSGKTYRLRGRRAPHPGFKGASIWEVYADPMPAPEPPPSLLRRLLARLAA